MTHDQIAALLTPPSPDVVRLFRVDDHVAWDRWRHLPTPRDDKRPILIGVNHYCGWQCATDARDLHKWWPEYVLREHLELGAKPRVVEVPREFCHDCGTQWCFDPSHAKDILQ